MLVKGELAMLEHYPLVVIVSAASSLVVAGVAGWWRAHREDVARRQEHFANALAAVAEYCEFPYVVRRRGASDPERERLRISSELRDVQQRIAFYQAWLRTESHDVADAYDHLVAEVRKVAGGQMHDAWTRAPIVSDEEMNIPDIALDAIDEFREAYLDAVRQRSSWRKRFSRGRRRMSE